MGKEKGLSQKEACERLAKYGPNRLPEKGPPSSLKVFLSQFKSPLVYVLLLGSLGALGLGEFFDALAIFLALMVNAGLGFYQERKASRALASLKAILHPQAAVIRDSQQKKVPVEEIVPGDLVVLHPGDKVPADGELVEAVDLTVNEAMLTGESMPVKKLTKLGKLDKLDQSVFMGTTVVSGRGLFEVTKTGVETEMGKIAKSLEEKEEPTPLQKQLGRLAKQLTVIILAICLGLLVGGFLRGWDFSEVILTSLAVAVAAIPEGLIVSLTVILALGMQTMAKKKGLVRKLVAAETLGGVTTICVDKTGTLTEGEMKVAKAELSPSSKLKAPACHRLAAKQLAGRQSSKLNEDLFIKSAVLCNNMSDTLEVAMVRWAEQKLGNKEIKKLRENYPRIDEIPFDPERKFMATLNQNKFGSGQAFLFVHGAPETILRKCKIKNEKLKIWENRVRDYGEQGYRMVGFAYKKMEKSKIKNQNDNAKLKISDIQSLSWQGLLLFEDPIRPGVAEALKECQGAGIKVKVITGDYPGTAVAVLEKLKISGACFSLGLSSGRRLASSKMKNQKLKIENFVEKGVMTGDQLEAMSDQELQDQIDKIVLFARTTPQQKLKIVKTLKANGEVVAMTGDGVNDAPALQVADIGIVVGEASDVAKETADLVLLDSNFATIVKAVSVGRSIFENIKKVVLYLLSDSFTEVILIGGSLLLGLPLPLLPVQILWVNLVEDGLPSVALAFEGEEKDLMAGLPKNPKEGILDAELKILIFIIGIMTDLALFGLFIVLSLMAFPLDFIRTILFLGLAINSLFYVFACRNLRKNLWQFNPFENRFLNFSVVLGFLFLISAIYLPGLRFLLRTESLTWEWWVLVLGIGMFDLVAIEIGKWSYLKIKDKR